MADNKLAEVERTAAVDALVEAWKQYVYLFTEEPHGTPKQVAALLELGVNGVVSRLLDAAHADALAVAAAVADHWTDSGGHVGTVGEHIRSFTRERARWERELEVARAVADKLQDLAVFVDEGQGEEAEIMLKENGEHMELPQYIELSTPTVNWEGLVPDLLTFAGHLALLHQLLFGIPLTMTSAKDGQHSAGSLHEQGKAFDVRTRDKSDESNLLLLAVLAFVASTAPIAVFDERQLAGAPHIHIEWHG